MIIEHKYPFYDAHYIKTNMNFIHIFRLNKYFAKKFLRKRLLGNWKNSERKLQK